MSLILFFHIFTGSIAVLSGITALAVKKGSTLHRKAGNLFFLSMLIMAFGGVVLAVFKIEIITILAGIFTCYLVATSWMAVKVPEGKIVSFDYCAPVIALVVGVAGVVYGLEAMNSASGLKNGFSYENYFFFGVLSLFAAAMDIRMLVCRGIVGAHRIARHLWRMCFALYIALGSLVTQGLKSFPESIRESSLISVPENLVALLMLFWLVRVLVTKKYKKVKVIPEQSPV